MARPELSPIGTPVESRAFPMPDSPKSPQGGISHSSGRQYTEIPFDESPIPSKATHSLTGKIQSPKAQPLNSHTAITEISSEHIITPTAIKALLGEGLAEASGFSSFGSDYESPIMTEEKDVFLGGSNEEISDEDLEAMKFLKSQGFSVSVSEDEGPNSSSDESELSDEDLEAMEFLKSQGFKVGISGDEGQVGNNPNSSFNESELSDDAEAMEFLKSHGFNVSVSGDEGQVGNDLNLSSDESELSDEDLEAMEFLKSQGFKVGISGDEGQVGNHLNSTSRESKLSDDAEAMEFLKSRGFNVSTTSEDASINNDHTIPSFGVFKERFKEAMENKKVSFWTKHDERGWHPTLDTREAKAAVDEMHGGLLTHSDQRESFTAFYRSHVRDRIDEYEHHNLDENAWNELMEFAHTYQSSMLEKREKEKKQEKSENKSTINIPYAFLRLSKKDDTTSETTEIGSSLKSLNNISQDVMDDLTEAENKKKYDIELAEQEKNQKAINKQIRIDNKNIQDDLDKKNRG